VRFPYAWVRVLFIVVIIPLFFSVPALLFAGLWFVMQVVQGASDLFNPFASSGIAWWAHIGGFIAGILMLRLLEPPHAAAAAFYNGGLWEQSGRR
jgi:membrane associated rhomboid family serine protease